MERLNSTLRLETNLRMEELEVQSLSLIMGDVLQGVGSAQELLAGGQVFGEALLQTGG